MAHCSEHNINLSASTSRRIFLDELNHHLLLKKNSAPWSYVVADDSVTIIAISVSSSLSGGDAEFLCIYELTSVSKGCTAFISLR